MHTNKHNEALKLIDQTTLKKLFKYKAGHLIWRERSNARVPAGSIAGSLKPSGYIYIRINTKPHYAHRLIFCYHNGYFPEFIDHINGVKNDNRIENLRSCTHSQNHSAGPKAMGKVKFRGVSKTPKGRFNASITKNKKSMHLGNFSCPKEAARAYDKAALKINGEFARVNGV